jgi:hypothetical protein
MRWTAAGRRVSHAARSLRIVIFADHFGISIRTVAYDFQRFVEYLSRYLVGTITGSFNLGRENVSTE